MGTDAIKKTKTITILTSKFMHWHVPAVLMVNDKGRVQFVGRKKSIRDGNIFKTFLHQNNSGTIVVLQIMMPASGMNNVAPVIKRI